jgi:hypothetical protein
MSEDNTVVTDVVSRDFGDSFTEDDSHKDKDYSQDKEYADMLTQQLVWFDLEGIRSDALGYSVKITGGNHRDVNKLRKRRTKGLAGGISLRGEPTRRAKSRSKSKPKEVLFSPESTQPNSGKEIRIEIRRSTEVKASEPGRSQNDEVEAWRSIANERDEKKEEVSSNGLTISERSLKLGSSPPLEEQEEEEEEEEKERPQMPSRTVSPISLNLDTQQELVPLSAIIYSGPNRNVPTQASWRSPPSSPRRRPIHTLNTSQRWAVHSPQSSRSASRISNSDRSPAPETDSSVTTDIAQTRDERNRTRTDGNMKPEECSTIRRVPQGGDAV